MSCYIYHLRAEPVEWYGCPLVERWLEMGSVKETENVEKRPEENNGEQPAVRHANF